MLRKRIMRLDPESVLVAEPAQNVELTSPSPDTSADFQEILALGIAAAQSGDRVSARRFLFQASGIDPRCEDIWMWLASISEYPEELLIFLGNVLDINPDNERAREWRSSTRSLLAKTFVQRAVTAHHEGSLPRAEQCIEQALAYDDSCSLAWLWKASLASDENEKIGFLEHVLEIDPENTDARSALDAVLAQRSHTAFNEVRSAAAAGRRKKALELVNEFLRAEPNIADAWILRSHLSIGLGEKIESLEHALEIDPKNATARSAYDFLVTTVGEPTTEDASEKENVIEDGLRKDECEPLIEKPLDSVFDLQQQYEEDFVVSGGATTNDPMDPAIPEPQEVDQYFLDAVTVDESSDRFENTFLESFDVTEHPDESEPVSEGLAVAEPVGFTPQSEPLELEELQPLELLTETSQGLYAGPEHSQLLVASSAEAQEPVTVDAETETADYHFDRSHNDCPYCRNSNENQAFYCSSCNAALSLSDIESLLHNTRADRETIQDAVTQMEAEWNLREFSELELTALGVGHFNLGDHEAGLSYLREALRIDPNNVILSGQINAIAIRVDEMRRQTENHGPTPRSKRILVVDDSPTVRKLIASKLEKSGHEVTCAEDGVEALEHLQAGLPDLVLLDISMPRMDGYEVCKHIRTNPSAKDLPVIMISGKDGFFDKVRGRMAGSTGYVTKPFGPETLMRALETYLLPDQDAVN